MTDFIDLTPARIEWMKALERDGGWVPQEHLPRTSTGLQRKPTVWQPLVRVGYIWQDKSNAGRTRVFAITEVGRHVLANLETKK